MYVVLKHRAHARREQPRALPEIREPLINHVNHIFEAGARADVNQPLQVMLHLGAALPDHVKVLHQGRHLTAQELIAADGSPDLLQH
eukprot:1582079-Pyramimonas_sp.AAC.1